MESIITYFKLSDTLILGLQISKEAYEDETPLVWFIQCSCSYATFSAQRPMN